MQSTAGDFVARARGPREKVTDRLGNILRDYQDDQIFYEMLQNADDAKATEMKVLLDWREAPETTDNLFQPDMQPWQGPAVWVYNDKLFSEQDFENIAKLGGHTKERDTSTIGKFGLGFSSVYHLTDVPCFISGSRYVIFDPYVKYLNKYDVVKDNSPGMEIDLEEYPKCLQTCSNQFKPFHNVFGCDTERTPFYFDGTLFRLPLRTEELVKNVAESNVRPISEKSFDPSTVKTLVDNFERNAEKVLLFTKHVQKVSFYFLPPDKSPENVIELFSVSKEEVQENETTGAVTFRVSTETKHTYTSSTLAVEALQKEISKTWLKVPYRGKENEEKEEENAYELSITHEGKQQGLVPFVEVATLHPTEDQFSLKGELFTFLPLSVETDLQVHINGCFSLTSNRRDIWKSLSEDNFNSKWNKALRLLVAQAYAALLSECQNVLSKMPYRECRTKCLSNYHKMFPKISESDTDYWMPMCKAVYKRLIEGKYAILPVVREKCIEWYPAGLGKDCSYFAFDTYGSVISDDLQATLINIGFKLTSCEQLRAKFMAWGCDMTFKVLTPRIVFKFLISKSCTLLNCEPRVQPLCDTPLKDSTTLRSLVDYIFRDFNLSAVDITEHSVPLLLTKDGLLRVFDAQNPKFCSPYSSLVPSHESQFVHDDFVKLFMPAVRSGTEVIKAFRINDLASMIDPAQHDKPPDSDWLKMFWTFVKNDIENRNQFCNFQELFKEYYVLPMVPVSSQSETTSGGKQPALQTLDSNDICKLSEASDVFFFPRSHQSLEMCRVLRSLGCRELDVNITSSKDVAKNCVATLDQPEKVAQFFLSKGKAQNHSSSIFNYLNAFITASAQSSVVKSLPIFETISGEVVSVAEKGKVGYFKMRYKVSSELSKHVFTCFKGILLTEKGMAVLYDKLGFTEVTFGQLYIRSVLSTLCNLPLNQILEHLQLIKDNLITELKEIRDYESLDILFQKLPEPLLKCAKELETGTYDSVDDLETRSKLIVNCSFQLAERGKSAKFLADLSEINFIPSCTADKRLREIHEVGETDERQHPTCISLVEGVSKSLERLFWTVAGLLPDWTEPICQLKIIKKKRQNVSLVIDNCSNVCKSLEKGRLQELSESAKERLMTVLKEMYAEFQKHSYDGVKRLKHVPIVPVEDRFVCANQLTKNIQKDIQPYLYSIPLQFGPYYKLFMSLGMSESPTIQQYCQVLEQISSQTRSKDLHPNERENVRTVVRALFQLLSGCKGQVPGDLPTIFLPDKLQRLYPSNEMYVSHNPRLEDSVKTLHDVHIVNLRECGVNGHPWNLVKCLPQTARPKLLKDLFREVYAEGTSIECCSGNPCPLVNCYQERLRSVEFAEGVCRIIKYAFIHDDPIDVSVENVSKTLETIQFICKSTLQSRIVRINGESEVQGSCRDVSYFVDHDDDGKTTIYLRHCTYPGNGPMVVHCVADCVRNLLSSKLHINPEQISARQVTVEWLISCSQTEDIRLVLAECHIPELDLKDHLQASLGKVIPEGHPDDDLLCLMSRNSDCQEGDFVGYQEDAMSDIYYGKIVCKVPGDCSQEDGPRYIVDLVTKVFECSFSHLYVFRRTSLPMIKHTDTASSEQKDQDDEFSEENIIYKLEYAENLHDDERLKEIEEFRKRVAETCEAEVLKFLEIEVARMDRERKEWPPRTGKRHRKERKTDQQDISSESESKEEACASTSDAVVENAATDEMCMEYLTRAKKGLEQTHDSLQSYYETKEEEPDISIRNALQLVDRQIEEFQAKMAPQKGNLKRQNETDYSSHGDVPSKKSKLT